MKTSSTVALTKVSEPYGIRLHAASAVTLTLHCSKKTLSTFFFSDQVLTMELLPYSFFFPTFGSSSDN